ncbi:hypothetical protein JCM10213v2_002581 [Rhodosporidiobolus nylandii]
MDDPDGYDSDASVLSTLSAFARRCTLPPSRSSSPSPPPAADRSQPRPAADAAEGSRRALRPRKETVDYEESEESEENEAVSSEEEGEEEDGTARSSGRALKLEQELGTEQEKEYDPPAHDEAREADQPGGLEKTASGAEQQVDVRGEDGRTTRARTLRSAAGRVAPSPVQEQKGKGEKRSSSPSPFPASPRKKAKRAQPLPPPDPFSSPDPTPARATRSAHLPPSAFQHLPDFLQAPTPRFPSPPPAGQSALPFRRTKKSSSGQSAAVKTAKKKNPVRGRGAPSVAEGRRHSGKVVVNAVPDVEAESTQPSSQSLPDLPSRTASARDRRPPKRLADEQDAPLAQRERVKKAKQAVDTPGFPPSSSSPSSPAAADVGVQRSRRTRKAVGAPYPPISCSPASPAGAGAAIPPATGKPGRANLPEPAPAPTFTFASTLPHSSPPRSHPVSLPSHAAIILPTDPTTYRFPSSSSLFGCDASSTAAGDTNGGFLTYSPFPSSSASASASQPQRSVATNALPPPSVAGRYSPTFGLLPLLPSPSSSIPPPPAAELKPVKLKPIKRAAQPPKPPKPKKETARTMHPALLSRDGWVECAKGLTLTKEGRPPVWAAGRQELCETLEYYKSYQGGHYDLQERCLGYLLDGFGTANDSGGGCSEAAPVPSSASSIPLSASPSSSSTSSSVAAPSSRPAYRLAKDQTRSNLRMRALYNCYEKQVPVVLIAGSRWEFFPRLGGLGSSADSGTVGDEGVEGARSEGETRYAVLGHYWVSEIWAEGEPAGPAKKKGQGKSKDGQGEQEEEEKGYHVRFKVRFEWVAAQGKPWFADVIGPEAELSPSTSGVPTSPASLTEGIFPFPASSPGPSSVALASPAPSPASSSESSSPSPSMLFDAASPTSTVPTSPSGSTFRGDGSEQENRDDAEAMVTCATCSKPHKRIYEEEIECYNEECERFFLLDGHIPNPASLTYAVPILSPYFTLPSTSLVPESIIPKTLQSLASTPSISDYSWAAWRGFGCSGCGRLSSRASWNVLRCAGCGVEVGARGRVFTAREFNGAPKKKKDLKGTARTVEVAPSASLSIPLALIPTHKFPSTSSALRSKRPAAPSFVDSSFDLTPLSLSGFTGYSVRLRKGASVHHLWPSAPEGYTEPDRLFEEYQGDEAGGLFTRNRLSTHKAAGSLLCQQFTFNAGEHYKHASRAATFPFPPDTAASSSSAWTSSAPTSSASTSSASTSSASNFTDTSHKTGEERTLYAPQCAKDARDYLKSVVQKVVGPQRQTEFNEILSVAYMTGGKMNYHDDGERGLGAYVASVSLGAAATMSFRPKAKKGKTGAKQSAADDEPSLTDDDEGETEKTSRQGKRRACLRVRLMHGDILIMDGEETQKSFEHMVEPEGLRFAATARFIGPDHLNPGPAHRTTTYGSGFAAHSTVPSRFAYQDAVVAPDLPPQQNHDQKQQPTQQQHLYPVPPAEPAARPSQRHFPPGFLPSPRPLPALSHLPLAPAHPPPPSTVAPPAAAFPALKKRTVPPPPPPLMPGVDYNCLARQLAPPPQRATQHSPPSASLPPASRGTPIYPSYPLPASTGYFAPTTVVPQPPAGTIRTGGWRARLY